MRGTVTRWGSHGYGFIRPDELAVDAWAHYRFLAEPDWAPMAGDRVEFQLQRLSDGRYQAWFVRPAPQTLPPPPPSGGAGGTVPTQGRQRGSGPEPTPLGTMGEALLRAGLARTGAGTTPVPRSGSDPSAPSDAASALDETTVPPAETVTVVATLHDRLAVHRAGAEQAAVALRSRVDNLRHRIAELEAEAGQLALRLEEHETKSLQEQTELITAAVTTAADELERLLVERRRAVEAVRPAREACVAVVGRSLVDEYEAIRHRLRTGDGVRDDLDRRAYEALERERRSAVAELAARLDALDSLPVPNARFTLFRGDPDGPCVFVGPLRGRRGGAGDVDDTAGVVRWRVACVFWQTVERASCELVAGDIGSEYGTVAGSMAARLGPCDPELFGVLLDEAWACRPSLETASVDFALETVTSVLPRFDPEPPVIEDGRPAVRVRAESDGATLPEVASRLGLPLRDLFVALQHYGLSVIDDALDAGAEESLRLLLGGFEQLELARGPAGPSEPEPQRATVEGARGVASRLLSKLLRDGRIGGRHTRVEHAYGHHFGDQEKALARRITDFLERDAILIFKLNEGAHHVSVNPRRLREVGEIIKGTWDRSGELERL